MSSPRKRGCFRNRGSRRKVGSVFPAQAGVFPPRSASRWKRRSLPRASGGVSGRAWRATRVSMSSPRKRGCFSWRTRPPVPRRVFPAQAGVFPSRRLSPEKDPGLPRASGGVSHPVRTPHLDHPSSPRKRGCFWCTGDDSGEVMVFPAQAGVFPVSDCPKMLFDCLPRASGGVSPTQVYFNSANESSPRKRGCFCFPRFHEVFR